MKNSRKLVLLLLVTTAFFNQLSAQVPDAVRVSERGFRASNPKAAQAERELLDSVVYLETYEGIIYGGDKQVWEYDSEGLTQHFSWYYWNTDAASWSGRQRVDSTFDASCRLSMLIKDSWDSDTREWKPNSKEEYKYNSDCEQYVECSWNAETKQWVNARKTESIHSYTENGLHIVISTNYTYDNIKGEWLIHHRNEMNYDVKGNQTLYNASFFDSISNTWVFKKGSFKYENVYNEQGKIILHSYYDWDSEMNQWKGQGDLLESGYDSIGHLTSVVTKNWDVSSNQWVNISKTENSYNEQGDVTGIIESEWDNEKSLWVVVTKQELLYNAHGNISNDQMLLLDTLSNEWYISTRDTFTYDVNNREKQIEQYIRNDEGQLVLCHKKESDYDAFGNVSLTTSFEFDTLSGNFIKNYDVKYTYNESGEKLIEEATSYYYESGSPYILKRNYYYSMHVFSAIDTEKETQSSFVYPSPFTDKLSFQLNNTNNQYVFELFNFQGQKVLSQRVMHSESINVANLPSGVYLYTLSLDNKVIKGKLIKK